MKQSFALASVLAVFCVACGSSSNAVSGTVGGATFTPADAIFYSTTSNSDSTSLATTLVVLSSTPNLCAELSGNTEHKGQKLLLLELLSSDSSGATATATGTFNTSASAFASANSDTGGQFGVVAFATLDSNCQASDANTVAASSGTVKLTSVGTTSGSKAGGSFDVTLSNNDHLSGNFSATFCAGLADDPNADTSDTDATVNCQ